MISDMVNRVAQVIEMGMASVGAESTASPDWIRDVAVRTAKEAIAAMREPTEEMKACSLRYLSEDLDYDEMYRRMIDAALAGETK